MAQSGGSGWGELGCTLVVIAFAGVLAAAGYGVYRLVSDWPDVGCASLTTESAEGVTIWTAPQGQRIHYELDGERLEARMPIGTDPRSGEIVMNGVRRVECR